MYLLMYVMYLTTHWCNPISLSSFSTHIIFSVVTLVSLVCLSCTLGPSSLGLHEDHDDQRAEYSRISQRLRYYPRRQTSLLKSKSLRLLCSNNNTNNNNNPRLSLISIHHQYPTLPLIITLLTLLTYFLLTAYIDIIAECRNLEFAEQDDLYKAHLLVTAEACVKARLLFETLIVGEEPGDNKTGSNGEAKQGRYDRQYKCACDCK